MIESFTPLADWVIVLPIVLALLGAAVTITLTKAQAWRSGVTLLVLLAIIACNAILVARVYAEGPLSMTMGKWLPPFGISLTADLLGACFALTASVITLLVLLYASSRYSEQASAFGFQPLVLLLLAGVTGSFLTGDLFNLYVWFEVMLIASFGLLVVGGRPVQLDATVKYGFLNFLATTLFLLALGLLYGLLGTLNMADILRVAPAAIPVAMAGVGGLLLLAFGMKAAAFPVNAWLPATYHAPPVAIAALMGGLLTKVGLYALLRSLVMLLPATRDLLEPILLAVAALTLVTAPLGAIAETNLRRAIGFLVIGGVGAVLAGIASPAPDAVAGASLYIFHSMLTMTALYLVAGVIEQRTGQVDTRHMGGLYAADAPASILFFVLVLAVAGLPPFLGFWPKLLLLQGTLGQAGISGAILTGALLVNAVLTLIAGTRIWAHVFWRGNVDASHTKLETGPVGTRSWLGIGPTGLLVAMILAAGLWPNFMFDAVTVAIADLLGPARYVAAVGLAGVSP